MFKRGLGKRVKVIDPNYRLHYNKIFYIVGTRDYTLSNGTKHTWYHIHEDKDSMWGNYFGKSQLEFIGE